MKCWLFIASKDHLTHAMEHNFIQQKTNKFDKMKKGDKFILYASKLSYNNKKKYGKFIGYGKVLDEKSTPYKTFFRRHVKYYGIRQEVPITDLLDDLIFIKYPTMYGMYLIQGFRSLPEDDYLTIKEAMKTQ